MSFGAVDATPCHHGIAVITQSQLASSLEVQSNTTLNVFLAFIPFGLSFHLIRGVVERSQFRPKAL